MKARSNEGDVSDGCEASAVPEDGRLLKTGLRLGESDEPVDNPFSKGAKLCKGKLCGVIEVGFTE